MDARRVLVIGAGLMGGGIAQVAAAAGHRVTLRDVSQRCGRQSRDQHRLVSGQVCGEGADHSRSA